MFSRAFDSPHPLSSMMKRLVLAALLALAGSVFALQGVGVLPGSVMTGDPKWAVIGTLMLMLAALLLWSAYRRSSR